MAPLAAFEKLNQGAKNSGDCKAFAAPRIANRCDWIKIASVDTLPIEAAISSFP